MQTTPSPAIRLRRDAWAAWTARLRMASAGVELAEHLGVHRATLYRVIGADWTPGEQFIAAVMAKYDGKFEDLFEVVTEAPG
jgi:hypothetical protein